MGACSRKLVEAGGRLPGRTRLGGDRGDLRRAERAAPGLERDLAQALERCSVRVVGSAGGSRRERATGALTGPVDEEEAHERDEHERD